MKSSSSRFSSKFHCRSHVDVRSEGHLRSHQLCGPFALSSVRVATAAAWPSVWWIGDGHFCLSAFHPVGFVDTAENRISTDEKGKCNHALVLTSSNRPEMFCEWGQHGLQDAQPFCMFQVKWSDWTALLSANVCAWHAQQKNNKKKQPYLTKFWRKRSVKTQSDDWGWF